MVISLESACLIAGISAGNRALQEADQGLKFGQPDRWSLRIFRIYFFHVR